MHAYVLSTSTRTRTRAPHAAHRTPHTAHCTLHTAARRTSQNVQTYPTSCIRAVHRCIHSRVRRCVHDSYSVYLFHLPSTTGYQRVAKVVRCSCTLPDRGCNPNGRVGARKQSVRALRWARWVHNTDSSGIIGPVTHRCLIHLFVLVNSRTLMGSPRHPMSVFSVR